MKQNELKDKFDMDYIDGILITDKKGHIQYSVRHNPNFEDESTELALEDILYKSIFEVYPSLNQDNSTIFQSIKRGKSVYLKEQRVDNYKGGSVVTQNLTIPIIKNGIVIGAVEMIKDITTMDDVERRTARSPLDVLSQKLSHHDKGGYHFEDIVTENNRMKTLIRQSKLAAKSPSSVLVYGETGTGKELFVQSIHNGSYRKNQPLIAQNCAAIPESIFESLLFGTVKGTYTGAEDKAGLFELADGGTLFLDEINSMPLNLQAKLLRVIQDGKVRRLGASKDIKVDVRIIAAMNVDPMEALEKKLLREDFFYRISVFSLSLLPLRERPEDINPLVEYFIHKHNKRLSKNVKTISDEVISVFKSYKWPGNVRELEHIIEGAINIVEGEVIKRSHLPAYLGNRLGKETEIVFETENAGFSDMVFAYEKRIIVSALNQSKGNISRASKLLKMPRQTLRYKMEKHKLFK